MNKRIVLLFVLGLLLCNVHNVVATPTTSLSDTEIEMLCFMTFEDVKTLFVMMCVFGIFIMGLGGILIVPEEEKSKKINPLNIKTKKNIFCLKYSFFYHSIFDMAIWHDRNGFATFC